MQNPSWIRAILTSAVLAWLLWWKLAFPFWTTFIVLGIIYTVVVISREGEYREAFSTFLGWLKSVKGYLVGFGIFLVLEYIAIRTLGIYPGDVWTKVGDSGGFYWIFWGHGVSTLFLAGLLLTIVLAIVAMNWTKKWGLVLIVAIVISATAVFVVEASMPDYGDTWYTRQDISRKLAKKGVIARIADILPTETPDYPICADAKDFDFGDRKDVKEINTPLHPECRSGLITTPTAEAGWEEVYAHVDKGGLELWYLDGYHVYLPAGYNGPMPMHRWMFRARGEDGNLRLTGGSKPPDSAR